MPDAKSSIGRDPSKHSSASPRDKYYDLGWSDVRCWLVCRRLTDVRSTGPNDWDRFAGRPDQKG